MNGHSPSLNSHNRPSSNNNNPSNNNSNLSNHSSHSNKANKFLNSKVSLLTPLARLVDLHRPKHKEIVLLISIGLCLILIRVKALAKTINLSLIISL